jgi:type IV pilus assembly protein PilO
MAITKEDLIKLSKWQKLFILAGLILLIGVLWYYLLYSAGTERIGVLNKEIADLDGQIAKQETAKKTKRTLEKQIAELEKELTILQAKLPEEKEIPALLSTVTEIGRLNGLEFELFKQENAVRKDYYSEIPVAITVEGGFHEVAKFLAQVGSMDRILHVSRLKMGKYKALDGHGILETSMKATTYKYEPSPLPQKGKKKR